MPPLANGHIRSMTLMPVTRISAAVDWSTKSGAARWIGRHRVGLDRAGLVDRVADDVHDPAERAGSDRHRIARPVLSVTGWRRGQAVGGVHGDGAHGVAEVLLRLPA